MSNKLSNFPLVSIIIPVYNGENYMKEAIESAISQTYPNIEIIVVNDGSTDGTESIALQYGDEIRYFRKDNGGVSTALNLGISVMKGTYFSWLSHDDVYLPNKIEEQVEALSKYRFDPKYIAYCHSSFIDSHSNTLKNIRRRRPRFSNTEINSIEVLQSIFKHGSINGCSLLIPRQAFDLYGNFNNEIRYSQDYLLWVTFFLNNMTLIVVNRKLVYSRIHSSQLTQRGRKLIISEGVLLCSLLCDKISNITTKKNKLLYFYIRRYALFNNKIVVSTCLGNPQIFQKLSLPQVVSIKFILLYSKIRPLLRNIYYKLFRLIK